MASATAPASASTGSAELHLGDGALRVLEAVAGHRAHDRVVRVHEAVGRRAAAAPRPTPRTPARRSTPSSDARIRYASRISASVHGADVAARLVARRHRPASTTPGSRSGSRWRSSRDAGPARRARSAPRPRPATRACAARGVARPRVQVLAVALPVRGDVAGVPDRDAVRGRAHRRARRRSRTRRSSAPRCGTG